MKKEKIFVVTSKGGEITPMLNIKDGMFGKENAAQAIGISLGDELKNRYQNIDAEEFMNNLVHWFRIAGRDPIMFGED